MTKSHDAEYDPFHPFLIELEEKRLRYFIEQPYSSAASKAAQAQLNALQMAKNMTTNLRGKA